MAKVLLIGPCKSGKSVIANFMVDAENDGRNVDYRPTQGVRILKYNTDPTGVRSDSRVDIWDCSGDDKFRECWPAIAQGASGVIICFDSAVNNQAAVDKWLIDLVKPAGVRAAQGLILANNPTGDDRSVDAPKLQGPLAKARLVVTDLKSDPDFVRETVSTFLQQIVEFAAAKNDKDEQSIMDGV